MISHVSRAASEWFEGFSKLPKQVRLAAVADRIQRDLGDASGAVAPADADASFERVFHHWESHGELRSLKSRDLFQAPWAFFLRPDARADNQAFALAYRVMAAERARVVRGLIGSFLTGYPAEWKSIQQWGDCIRSALARNASGLLAFWSEVDRQHDVFGSDGPKRFAALWQTCAPDVQQLNETLGLRGAMCEGGFFKVGAEAVLLGVRDMLQGKQVLAPDRLSELCRLALVDGGKPRAGLRAPLAHALLRPFVSGALPNTQCIGAIVSTMTRAVSDPRLQPAAWQGLEPESAVMRRLLVDQTIEFFFELLAQTADRPDQWAERRHFWDQYRATGRVHDARVALGPEAVTLAKFRNPEMLQYCARFMNGYDPTHSILVMRIGQAVVVEGSHNMKVRVWDSDDLRAPSLQARSYDRSRVVGQGIAPFEKAHQGRWQQQVAWQLRNA